MTKLTGLAMPGKLSNQLWVVSFNVRYVISLNFSLIWLQITQKKFAWYSAIWHHHSVGQLPAYTQFCPTTLQTPAKSHNAWIGVNYQLNTSYDLAIWCPTAQLMMWHANIGWCNPTPEQASTTNIVRSRKSEKNRLGRILTSVIFRSDKSEL